MFFFCHASMPLKHPYKLAVKLLMFAFSVYVTVDNLRLTSSRLYVQCLKFCVKDASHFNVKTVVFYFVKQEA